MQIFFRWSYGSLEKIKLLSQKGCRTLERLRLGLTLRESYGIVLYTEYTLFYRNGNGNYRISIYGTWVAWVLEAVRPSGDRDTSWPRFSWKAGTTTTDGFEPEAPAAALAGPGDEPPGFERWTARPATGDWPVILQKIFNKFNCLKPVFWMCTGGSFDWLIPDPDHDPGFLEC